MPEEFKNKKVIFSVGTIAMGCIALIAFSFGLGVNISGAIASLEKKIQVNAVEMNIKIDSNSTEIKLTNERFDNLKSLQDETSKVTGKIYDMLYDHVNR